MNINAQQLSDFKSIHLQTVRVSIKVIANVSWLHRNIITKRYSNKFYFYINLNYT